MTTQEMHDFFDIIQDKYASPYFTSAEKDLLLNRAQVAIVEEFLPSTYKAVVTPEASSIVFDNLDSIVYSLTGLTTTSGTLLKSTIQTALNTASGTTEPYLVLLNVGRNGNPCRYVRHNDWLTTERNEFKRGTTDAPVYSITSNSILIKPSTTDTLTSVTVLKRPVDIELNVTECELPDKLHNRLLAIGIEFAGIASRDEALSLIKQV